MRGPAPNGIDVRLPVLAAPLLELQVQPLGLDLQQVAEHREAAGAGQVVAASRAPRRRRLSA